MIDALTPVAPQAFEVHPDNWQTVEMFLRLQTQWVIIPGGFTGLNYLSVNLMCDVFGIADKRGLFDALQVMELAALEVLNERKD